MSDCVRDRASKHGIPAAGITRASRETFGNAPPPRRSRFRKGPSIFIPTPIIGSRHGFYTTVTGCRRRFKRNFPFNGSYLETTIRAFAFRHKSEHDLSPRVGSAYYGHVHIRLPHLNRNTRPSGRLRINETDSSNSTAIQN